MQTTQDYNSANNVTEIAFATMKAGVHLRHGEPFSRAWEFWKPGNPENWKLEAGFQFDLKLIDSSDELE